MSASCTQAVSAQIVLLSDVDTTNGDHSKQSLLITNAAADALAGTLPRQMGRPMVLGECNPSKVLRSPAERALLHGHFCRRWRMSYLSTASAAFVMPRCQVVQALLCYLAGHRGLMLR